ncbi:MAG: hypothetical protein AB7V48_13200 [Sedimentibacter sp.]
MSYYKEDNITVVKNEWNKMISGQPVDKNNLSPMVFESWQRSLQAGVDPICTNLSLKIVNNCDMLKIKRRTL